MQRSPTTSLQRTGSWLWSEPLSWPSRSQTPTQGSAVKRTNNLAVVFSIKLKTIKKKIFLFFFSFKCVNIVLLLAGQFILNRHNLICIDIFWQVGDASSFSSWERCKFLLVHYMQHLLLCNLSIFTILSKVCLLLWVMSNLYKQEFWLRFCSLFSLMFPL